jgi:alkylated DNA repair dioxygenase AlkB
MVTPKTSRNRRELYQDDLFTPEPTQPAGFHYREEMMTAAEEAALVEQFRTLPSKPFDFHGHAGNRRVVYFGWRYDYAGRALQESEPIPSFLRPLRDIAAAFADVSVESLQQVLINEYPPGAGIGWHRDRPMFEDVIAFSLLAPCMLRFRYKQGAGWERSARPVAPRSAYLLRGPSRREWEHSITPMDRLRYSVTFRNFTPPARE